MSKNNYIWLISENHGSTASNNSYFFWKRVVNIKDGIDKYVIFEKNKETQKTYDSLSDHEKKFVLWKNSRKHVKIFYDADMYFVTLSYKDVTPTKKFFKNVNLKVDKPVIYLRHGIAGMKSTNYDGKSYWNNMVKFLSYNTDEIGELLEKNNFERHQICSFKYQPRYCELIRKNEEFTNKKQILWFITWREYFGPNTETKIFINAVNSVLKSKKLIKYLKDNDLTLTLCVHQFFDRDRFGDIYKYSKKGIIDIVHSKDIDVMDELARSKMLITDFSSVAYDFSFLNKPVLLFQPDLEIYNKLRDFICDISEMEKYNIENSQELVNSIVNEDYDLNPFFRNIWPEIIDYEAIKENKHIDEMYEYFSHLQENKITVLGYNFYEHDGIVNSTMSLVEMLMDNDYLVEVISLYREKRRFNAPNGLHMEHFYWKDNPSLKERISYKLQSVNNNYGYLKYDSKIDKFHPSIGYRLNKLLKNIHSNTVISTRESLHLYLDACKSDKVKNKIYCFNAPVDYNKEKYGELLNKISNIDIEKSIFASERDIDFYENKLNFRTPSSKLIEESYILENQILKPINIDSIFIDENYKLKEVDLTTVEEYLLRKEYRELRQVNIEEKDAYNGLCIVNVDEYYLDDLNNIIQFGNYLKDHDIKNITLDVIGRGDYSLKFIDMIAENDLFAYINYLGNNINRINAIRKHDFILDLDNNPNYNTVYLQGVLNYKKVFCLKNDKSSKILNEIPNTFIESHEWLCDQITNLHKITLKDLYDYYNIVKDKHLEKEFSKKLIEYIEE